MKILHTADWHLGRTLYNRKRYSEFTAFLTWLADLIGERQIDVLVIAGDIFDTSTPSNRAQTLYYQFLMRAAAKGCRHMVIIGGNHDSPTFLNAPQVLLASLNIHVIGAVTDPLDDEVLVLHDQQLRPELIVCAVPFLRDKDIRTVGEGESLDDKNQKLTEGIKAHYDAVWAIARQKQQQLGEHVPIVATGHLFATGGQTAIQDGVRELYVGSLAQVTAQTFAAQLDYVALGHLHIAQQVGNNPRIRYSGSPIAMGYGEVGQQKKVIELEFCSPPIEAATGTTVSDVKTDLTATAMILNTTYLTQTKRPLILRELAVPCFQPLAKISGSLTQLLTQISDLKQQQSQTWLEVDYTDTLVVADLAGILYQAIADSSLVILRIKNRPITHQVLKQQHQQETLEQLDEQAVFQRCLEYAKVPPAQWPELQACYQTILHQLQQADPQAE